LLRRAQPYRDRVVSRTAARHGEDAHPTRHDTAPGKPGRRREGITVRNGQDTHDDGETAALYALGALDAEAARAFEGHLAEGCTQCATELESHASVARNLVFDPEPVPPPPAVRARLLEAIAAEPAR